MGGARAPPLAVRLDPSAAWTADTPAFAIAAGERGSATLARLLAVTGDFIRPAYDSGGFQVCSFSDSSPRATYALPLLAGLHAVLELEDADELAPNWARVQGPDRYADSFYELFGSDDVFARGPVAQLLRDQDADDDTKASARALAAMQRARHLTPRGRVTTVANVGHELFDIVRIRHRANPNHSSVDFYRRAVGIALDYRASPAAGATAFTQTLELADWEAFN